MANNTLWDTYQEELEQITCENCGGTENLYDLQGETSCVDCLKNTKASDL